MVAFGRDNRRLPVAAVLVRDIALSAIDEAAREGRTAQETGRRAPPPTENPFPAIPASPPRPAVDVAAIRTRFGWIVADLAAVAGREDTSTATLAVTE
jgi:hypothetical protein